jgi:hypothetical protein
MRSVIFVWFFFDNGSQNGSKFVKILSRGLQTFSCYHITLVLVLRFSHSEIVLFDIAQTSLGRIITLPHCWVLNT